MAACEPFDIDIRDEPAAVVRRMKQRIESVGGALQGDDRSGAFSGSTPAGPIRGSYRAQAGFITVYIDEKPSGVPCGMIESQIRQHLK